MIASLAWKEYREQRGIWLAIALLAGLLALNMGLLARGGFAEAHNDVFVREIVIGVLYSLMVAQGVVYGAQALANEKESGSLGFLDALSSQRYPLWHTKLVVGSFFTLVQGLVLFGLILALQMGNWTHLFSLMVVGLLALCWGMVGGALCASVFPAILTGIVLAAANLAILFIVPVVIVPIVREVALIAVAVVALIISKQSYCATDHDRRLRQAQLQGGNRQRRPKSWQTLVWLAAKQGRWILCIGLGMSFLAGFVMYRAPDFSWPVVTLIIGLTCGTAVFAPEQAGEQERFLGAQRFPPGRLWLVKTAFWILVAAGMTALLGVAMLLRHDLALNLSLQPLFYHIFSPDGYPGLFPAMWVIYGFCFGQFCSLLSRNVVVAGVLGAGTSVGFLALWLPSLFFRDVMGWQILTIPLLLLVGTRSSMWIWYSGRVFTRRHIVGLVCCMLLAVMWLGGNLWYRAVEIPDVGEPFDLQTFETKLNQAAQSQAPALIRRGTRAMIEERSNVKAKLGRPTKPLFPIAPNAEGFPHYLADGDYMAGCWDVLYQGWPAESDELGRWLDAMFAGEWAQDIREAAAMPLGLIADPRDPPRSSALQDGIDFRDVGALFVARALQLESRGDYSGALKNLETVLGFSRQLWNCAPTSLRDSRWQSIGTSVEWIALRGLDRWLAKIGPRPELLRQALKALQHHEKEVPDPLDNIKADYLQGDTASLYWHVSKLGLELVNACPWERERQSRFFRAFYSGQLRLAKWPPPHSRWPHETLALADGGWTAEQWHQFMMARGGYGLPQFWAYDFPPYLRQIRVRQVYIALMVYQAEEGHAAAKLEDLVPRYLSNLPLDPWTGQSYSYKVSQGEKIPEIETKDGYVRVGENSESEQIPPGHGVLCLEPISWSYGHLDHEAWYFVVPAWMKK